MLHISNAIDAHQVLIGTASLTWRGVSFGEALVRTSQAPTAQASPNR